MQRATFLKPCPFWGKEYVEQQFDSEGAVIVRGRSVKDCGYLERIPICKYNNADPKH